MAYPSKVLGVKRVFARLTDAARRWAAGPLLRQALDQARANERALMALRAELDDAKQRLAELEAALARAKVATRAEGVDPEPAPPPAVDRDLRVLVADDNPTNRKVVELILAREGARVVCVEDGVEAVEAFEAERFDVILMDLQMPRMDGLTAIRTIRDREAGGSRARTPIVVLSANDTADHRRASAAAGADDHMGKPFRAEDLVAAVLRFAGDRTKTLARAI